MAPRQSNEALIEIGGRPVEVTNLDKVFWPEEAITKGDMIAYYREISEYILPYLIDRPQSLNRFPNGITGKNFFQKDVDDAPDWIETVRVESETSPQGSVDYLVCTGEAALVFMVNLGCIELNPWNSRLGSLERPDYLVIDLDPEGRTFEEVIQVAQVVHTILRQAGADSQVKTSGKTGLHVYVPLDAEYSYETARQFARRVVEWVNQQSPRLTSLERSPKKRKGKVYLDYLQNSRGQTLAAPYSLRPRPGAPVSTPLDWDELAPGLSPLDFNYNNIRQRLADRGDIFKPVMGKGIDLAACLVSLEGK
jgi:bifunctional non-homologous end joining protein LigD